MSQAFEQLNEYLEKAQALKQLWCYLSGMTLH